MTATLPGRQPGPTPDRSVTLADDERSLTIRWEEPMRSARLAASMSGLQFLRAIASGEVSPPPIAQLMGFERPVEVEEGRVVFAAHPGEEHYNPIGTVHGGFAATLLDTALGCAVQSTLPAGTAYTTLELKVNLVRPITAETGRTLAEGKVVHRGGRVATAEGRIVAEESGKLLAHGSATCMVFEAPAP